MSSRLLSDLDPRFLPIAERLLSQCESVGIPVQIITTLRTREEQAEAVKHGASWTMNSKHLPQPPSGLSLAIDICPKELITQKNWAPKHPLWWKIGVIGQGLGLRWGGDWNDVGPSVIGVTRRKWDPSHFEWRG